MSFLKKHYEKILLGVVLLGLAVAVAFIPLKIASEKQSQEEKRSGVTVVNPKPLQPLALDGPENTLKRLASPVVLDFSTTNRIFNPMVWKKTADDRLIKDDSKNLGPEAVKITKTTPLYLIVCLDMVTPGENETRYVVS